MNARDRTFGVVVACVWGLNFVVIDQGLHGVPPLLFAAIRFAVVALLALVLPRPEATMWRIATVGLFMSAGQFGFLYAALGQGMSAGLASLLLQAQVPLTILIATAVLHERSRTPQRVGVAVAVAGLAVIAIGRGSTTTFAGLGLLLCAASSWAVGNVAARGVRASGLSLVAWGSVFVPAPLLGASLALEGLGKWRSALEHWGWTQTASTGYTVIVATVIGFGLWNGLLAKHPAAEVVPFALLVPVAGVLSAWLIQSTLPSTGEAIGGAVLVAGAGTAVLTARPRSATPPTGSVGTTSQAPPVSVVRACDDHVQFVPDDGD